jgi:hypothetical protein
MAFVGVVYRTQWQGRRDFTLGVLQESYDENVLSPDFLAAQLTDLPLPTGARAKQRKHSQNATYLSLPGPT